MWLLIPILFYTLIFLCVRHVYTYWQRKGFPHERSNLSLTFLKHVYSREFFYHEAVNDFYRLGKERFIGIYCLFRPVLLIRDLTLARSILENHHGHFNDTKWDYKRSYRKYNLLEKLAPIFAAARLEAMLRNVEKVGDHMLNHLQIVLGSDGNVDMQRILRIYAVNVIANLIYGLDIDVFKQTDSVFRLYLNNTLRQSAVSSYTLRRLPKKSSLTYRLRDLIRQNVERREEGGMIRKDILQMLVKFRNGNDIESKDKLNWHLDNLFDREKVLSVKKMADIAEYLLENSLATITSMAVFTLYELMKQPKLMEEVSQEVRNEQGQEKEQLSYGVLRKMKLMDLCIQETLRKYPSVPVIERTCRKAFPMPNSKKVLNEGRSLIIPLLAIQRDGKYFEEPLHYRPQRFMQDSNGNQAEHIIGCGLGAKTCIAQNFIKLVVKYVLAKLLLTYSMELLPSSAGLDIAYNDTPSIQSPEGLKVRLKPAKVKFEI